MKTLWERQEERRAEKLADIRDQVAQGTLRIRQMTAKERAENPPRPESPRISRRPTRKPPAA
jgi:hypothetical protein